MLIRQIKIGIGIAFILLFLLAGTLAGNAQNGEKTQAESLVGTVEPAVPVLPDDQIGSGFLPNPDELDKVLDSVNRAPPIPDDVGGNTSQPPPPGTESTVELDEISHQVDRAPELKNSGIGENVPIESGMKTKVQVERLGGITASQALSIESVTKLKLNEESQKPIYTVKVEQPVKLFGIFSVTMKIETKVSAETGHVLEAKKPWWRIFAW